MSVREVESSQVLCVACQNVRHSPELHICGGCYDAVTAAVNLREAVELSNRVSLGERMAVPAFSGAVRLGPDGLTLK
jgi:hypothetical protein